MNKNLQLLYSADSDSRNADEEDLACEKPGVQYRESLDVWGKGKYLSFWKKHNLPPGRGWDGKDCLLEGNRAWDPLLATEYCMYQYEGIHTWKSFLPTFLKINNSNC